MIARREKSEREVAVQEMVSAAARPRVVLAEDDDAMRRLLANGLRRDGFEVVEVCSGAELVEELASSLLHPVAGRAVDLIISDIRMPWASGLTVLAALRRYDWATPAILITAFGDDETHSEAKRLGAAAVFDKPFDMKDLRTSARQLAGVG